MELKKTFIIINNKLKLYFFLNNILFEINVINIIINIK